MIIRWSATATLVLGMAGAPGLATAQVTGALTGVITDSSGASVPGAMVEAINRGTAHVRTTVTSADGFYTIPLLTPAVYRVKAALQGFRTSIRDDIEILVNETARADFTLEVGDIAEHVTVEGGSSLVETRKATLGIVVDEQKIVDLPLNGRNFTQLGTLVPGVVAPPSALGGQNGNATPGGIGNVTGGFNVNGMRNQSNNFLLDGASNNDTFNTGFVLRPPPDAIQEFKILTHAYDAEYGRNAGSIVNVVTRSGTNAWHATAWEFNRDGALQARNFFAQSSPVLEQNQFGGAIGGPLTTNRLFVFSYAEGFRNTEGQTDTRTVLSAAQRRGDFSEQAGILDPLTGQPFPGNIIPVNRIDPLVTRILDGYVPLPNAAANRVVRAPNLRDTRGQFGVRFDLKAGASHSVLARYILGRTRNVNPLGGSNFLPASNTATATLQDVTVSDTWVLRNNRINVLRISLNRIDAKPTSSSGVDPRSFGFAYSASGASATSCRCFNPERRQSD